MRFKLINNIGHVNSRVIVVENAIERTGCCGNVVGLTGVGYAKIVIGEAILCSRSVNERSIGVANQGVKAGVLHHDYENMLEILQIGTTVLSAEIARGENYEQQ